MSGINLLLIDDEVGFIETMAKRLGRRGFVVHQASSAESGFQVLAREAVQVVVLDVRMPGIDGLTALEVIKRDHPAVEVILLTGHASLEACTTGMDRGAFDYLLKPASLEELIYKVEDAARRGALWSDDGSTRSSDRGGAGR